MPKIVQIMSIEIEIHFLNSSQIFVSFIYKNNFTLENQDLYIFMPQNTRPLGDHSYITSAFVGGWGFRK